MGPEKLLATAAYGSVGDMTMLLDDEPIAASVLEESCRLEHARSVRAAVAAQAAAAAMDEEQEEQDWDSLFDGEEDEYNEERHREESDHDAGAAYLVHPFRNCGFGVAAATAARLVFLSQHSAIPALTRLTMAMTATRVSAIAAATAAALV